MEENVEIREIKVAIHNEVGCQIIMLNPKIEIEHSIGYISQFLKETLKNIKVQVIYREVEYEHCYCNGFNMINGFRIINNSNVIIEEAERVNDNYYEIKNSSIASLKDGKYLIEIHFMKDGKNWFLFKTYAKIFARGYGEIICQQIG